MAVQIIFGPGGSGKSYLQVKIIERQIRDTPRNVLTNLSLDVPALAAYFERQYPAENYRVGERIRLMTEEETLQFWRYRGNRVYKPGTDYEYYDDPGVRGVCYVIDEAGAAGFSAQGWATSVSRSTRGVDCSAYLDQQRKYGDDVFASTNGRTPNQIAKAFRDKCHTFIGCRNEYQAKYGVFRGRGRFVARYYSGEPTGSSDPYLVETWKIDTKGLAACYRTEQGIGVTGVMADKGTKAKGISVWWVIPAALALCSLCFIVPYFMGRGAQKYIAGNAKPIAAHPVAVAGQIVPIPGRIPDIGSGAPGPGQDLQPYPTGFIVKNGRVNVTMSDGTIRTELDKELTAVARGSVTLGGKKTFIRPRTSGDSAGKAVAGALPSSHLAGGSPPGGREGEGARVSSEDRTRGAWRLDSDGVQRLIDKQYLSYDTTASGK